MSPIQPKLFFRLDDLMSLIDEQPNRHYRHFFKVADLLMVILVVMA